MNTGFNFRNIMCAMAASLLVVAATLTFGSCSDKEEEFMGNWVAMPDFSGMSRYGAASFVIGDKAYVVGGYNANERQYLRDCWCFDLDNNQWTKLDTFPGEGRVYAFGFEANGKGYVGCGYRGDTQKYYNDVYEFDPTSNKWISVGAFANDTTSAMAMYGATAFSINGIGYVVGGYRQGQGTLNEMWAFDPSQPDGARWSEKPHITKKRYYAQAFVLNGKGYVIGGNSNNTFPTDLYAYDPASNQWERKRSITNATDDDFDDEYQNIARQQACAFVIDNLGYITLGATGTTISTTWEYDPKSDLWSRKTDFEGTARVNAISFTLRNRGFITTGGTQSSSYDDTWEFKPFNQKVSGD